MSQVVRQHAAEIQAGKRARAGHVSAELDHLIVGINDNDDRVTVNETDISDNSSEIVVLRRGDIEVTNVALADSPHTITDADGEVIVFEENNAAGLSVVVPDPALATVGRIRQIFNRGPSALIVTGFAYISGYESDSSVFIGENGHMSIVVAKVNSSPETFMWVPLSVEAVTTT